MLLPHTCPCYSVLCGPGPGYLPYPNISCAPFFDTVFLCSTFPCSLEAGITEQISLLLPFLLVTRTRLALLKEKSGFGQPLAVWRTLFVSLSQGSTGGTSKFRGKESWGNFKSLLPLCKLMFSLCLHNWKQVNSLYLAKLPNSKLYFKNEELSYCLPTGYF